MRFSEVYTRQAYHFPSSFAYSQTLMHHDIFIAHIANRLRALSDDEAGIVWEKKKIDDRL